MQERIRIKITINCNAITVGAFFGLRTQAMSIFLNLLFAWFSEGVYLMTLKKCTIQKQITHTPKMNPNFWKPIGIIWKWKNSKYAIAWRAFNGIEFIPTFRKRAKVNAMYVASKMPNRTSWDSKQHPNVSKKRSSISKKRNIEKHVIAILLFVNFIQLSGFVRRWAIFKITRISK
mgnify:CR=1 FL=1